MMIYAQEQSKTDITQVQFCCMQNVFACNVQHGNMQWEWIHSRCRDRECVCNKVMEGYSNSSRKKPSHSVRKAHIQPSKALMPFRFVGMRMAFEQIEFFSLNTNECYKQVRHLPYGKRMRGVEYLAYEMTTSMATQSFHVHRPVHILERYIVRSPLRA